MGHWSYSLLYHLCYTLRMAQWTSYPYHAVGFPRGSDSKATACNAGDLELIHGQGRSPGEGNGNPLQYPCLKNAMDEEAWWATVHEVAKSQTQLSDFTFTFTF